MIQVAASPPAPPVFEIRPTTGWRSVDLRELWLYRELLLIFVWRDLRVRYRQMTLGVAWVVAQPLVTMVIFTFIFSRVAKIKPPGDVPYPLFVLAGLLPWTFFVSGVQNASASLAGATQLLSKVYFPRLALPIAAVLVGLVDLLVAGLLLVAMMALYGVAPGASALLLPLVVLVALALATGLGLWLAALNVEYRDVRILIPIVLQLWMYVTPVVFPAEAIPLAVRRLLTFNPMTGIVESFRWCLLGGEIRPLPVLVSVLASGVALLTGALYFKRVERTFADLL